MQGLYTIPRCYNFLAELARGIVADYAQKPPEALAEVTILLPSKRAVRTLKQAFLQHAGTGRAMLLPRIIIYGELDGDELALAGYEAQTLNMPPVIDGLERQWYLAEMLCKRTPDLSMAQALVQACDLARLIDQMEIYGKTEHDLKNLAGAAELADHWGETLQFLEVITKIWPNFLAASNMSDPAAYRTAMLRAQAAYWRETKPQTSVIMAGLARAEPPSLDLAQSVLELPQGVVVLPGFDSGMTADDWLALDEVHPDYLLKDLLEQMPATREDVKAWPGTSELCPQRAEWLREALRPASNTEAWRRLQSQPLTADVLDNITLVTAATEQEEALSIALIIRDALNVPAQTISLVTPDRHLARLVAGQLKRWGVTVDDSSGIPLHRLPLGMYLLLIVAACQPRANLFDALALTKHPLTQMGMAEGAAHEIFRDIEKYALRAGFVGNGLDAWQRAIDDDRAFIEPEARTQFTTHFATWLEILSPLRALLQQKEKVRLEVMLDAHLAVAEALASLPDLPEAEILWAGEAGEAAANFFFEARRDIGHFEIEPGDYAELLNTWLTPINVRVPQGQHPRVTIHGLIEARLQQADVMVLGGLNEGVWPPAAPVSPFLSRRMMKDLGLPDPETRIAAAAHDFVSAASAPRVVLTRAERVQNVPTVPARWLLRMQAVLTDASLARQFLSSGDIWTQYAGEMDKPANIRPMAVPAPTPPRAARPRKLSVTQVEQWLADPYGLYARKILGLRALQKLQLLPTVAQRGQLVHAALEAFTAETLGRGKLYPEDYKTLLAKGQAELARYKNQPDIHTLWQAYYNIVADWFFALEQEKREVSVPKLVEENGAVTLGCASGDFTVTARADRVDVETDGSARIIDYKTGTVPSQKQIKGGSAVQLTLEALMASRGGFSKLGAQPVSAVEYWKAAGRDDSGKLVEVSQPELGQIIEQVEAAIIALVDAFAAEDVAYLPTPLPGRAPRYNDYAHLERTLEWAFADGGEEAE